MARKTKLMLRVEKEQGRPLVRLLPEMIHNLGLNGTAEELGVTRATLAYWLLKLGINVRGAALASGEKSLEVVPDFASTAIPRSKRPRIRGATESGRDLSAQTVEPVDAELLKALIHAQELVRQYVPEGRSLVDELIQQRRAEAAVE